MIIYCRVVKKRPISTSGENLPSIHKIQCTKSNDWQGNTTPKSDWALAGQTTQAIIQSADLSQLHEVVEMDYGFTYFLMDKPPARV